MRHVVWVIVAQDADIDAVVAARMDHVQARGPELADVPCACVGSAARQEVHAAMRDARADIWGDLDGMRRTIGAESDEAWDAWRAHLHLTCVRLHEEEAMYLSQHPGHDVIDPRCTTCGGWGTMLQMGGPQRSAGAPSAPVPIGEIISMVHLNTPWALIDSTGAWHEIDTAPDFGWHSGVAHAVRWEALVRERLVRENGNVVVGVWMEGI